MKKLNFLVLIFFYFMGYSQNENQLIVIPPALETAPIEVSSVVNAGLVQGTLQYAVELFKINGKNLSQAIPLIYTTDCVNVNATATCLKTDWNLNLNCLISRSIICVPNEPSTILNYSVSHCFSYDDFLYLQGHNSDFDYRSDLFSWNFTVNSFEFYLENSDKPNYSEFIVWKITGHNVSISNNYILNGIYTDYFSIGSNYDFKITV